MMEKYVVKQVKEAKRYDEEWLEQLIAFCDNHISILKIDLAEIKEKGRDEGYPYAETIGGVFAKYEEMLKNQLEQIEKMRSSLRITKLSYKGHKGCNELVEEYEEFMKDQVSAICAQFYSVS